MLQWVLGLTRLYLVRNEDVRKILGVAPISEKMSEARLCWYGHVVHSGEESVAGRALQLSPDGRRPRGQSKEEVDGPDQARHETTQYCP